MEMRITYFLWALLPLTLFVFSFKAGLQKVRKTERQEPGTYYLQQFIFSLLLFFISVGLDIGLFDEYFAPSIAQFTGADPGLFRWLIYPAVLTAAVLIRDIIDKKPTGK